MPLSVRVAAGLVATALEQARKIPEQLVELPVTAASRAVQAGMRVQQRITELAIKGDEVFAMFQPVQDTPPWARFDEDDEFPGQPPDQVPSDSGPGTNGRGEIDEATVAQELTPDRPVAADRTQPEVAKNAQPEAANKEPTEPPGYDDELSLAQLRGKLHTLSLAELEELLEHEHTHQNRAPFVTMLSNRIITVRSR
ncbi:MAG: lipid droplet-associated protein [Pseudonocardiaceae bacterium]